MWMCLLTLSFAQDVETEVPAPRLELSFGSGLLFVEQTFASGGLQNQTQERVVPVPSWLLLGEYMWSPGGPRP